MISLSSFAVILLALPSLISAVPATTAATLIDPIDFDTISYYEQFAAASYCLTNVQGGNTNLICEKNNCPDVQRNKVRTTFKFDQKGTTNTTGFVAVDKVRNLIVVSFRGTQTFGNLQADFNLGLTALDICNGTANCLGHAGFFQSWKDVRDMVIPEVMKASTDNPGFRVVSTGHSLGAAVASIAALELRNNNLIVDMANYGSPRVGNSVFATLVALQDPLQGRNFRVAHVGDLAPASPANNLNLNGFYAHILPELLIVSGNVLPPTPGEIIINLLDNDVAVVTSLADVVNGVTAHGFYFNEISSCGAFSVLRVTQMNIPAVRQIFNNLAMQFRDLVPFNAIAQTLLTVLALFPIPANA